MRALLLSVALPLALISRGLAGDEQIPNVAPTLFQRVVVLGASVSAGFDCDHPFGSPATAEFRLANFIEAALTGSREPIRTYASPLVFLSPIETTKSHVAEVVATKPSLVIGIDALFWFCYGTAKPEERVPRFEQGLRMLEAIDAPLIVGDIPDASSAMSGVLSKAQVPPPEILAACNERLQTWAAKRKNVTIFPLSRVMAAALKNEELTFGQLTFAKGKTRGLLQRDKLHPSRRGLAALAIAVLDVAAEGVPSLESGIVRRDVGLVLEDAVARAFTKPAAPATDATQAPGHDGSSGE